MEEAGTKVPSPPVAGTEFQQLECLFLGNNRIHSWGSIDALTYFSNLKELRLSGNPLTPISSKEERFEVRPAEWRTLWLLPHITNNKFLHAISGCTAKSFPLRVTMLTL